MQTRSSSSSSVATAITKKQYTVEEADIIMQKINEKERQLKEQAEALQAKHDHLTRQEEANRKELAEAQNQPTMEQLFVSINTMVHQMERINSRITNLETLQGKERYAPQEGRSITSPIPHHFDMMDQPSPIRLKDAIL